MVKDNGVDLDGDSRSGNGQQSNIGHETAPLLGARRYVKAVIVDTRAVKRLRSEDLWQSGNNGWERGWANDRYFDGSDR